MEIERDRRKLDCFLLSLLDIISVECHPESSLFYFDSVDINEGFVLIFV